MDADERMQAIASAFAADMRQLYDLELVYDAPSVARLDAFIEEHRPEVQQGDVEALSGRIGVFLGQCMVATYGGRWQYEEERGEWGIDFGHLVAEGFTAFPISKAYKHITQDHGDSILSFFGVSGAIIAAGGISKLGPP